MKYFWLILVIIFLFSNNVFPQDKSFCPTYVYEGYIKTEKGKKLEINLNFLVLLDSTMVGSYYYKPKSGSLKIVGHLNKDKSFNLVERDKNDSITGSFKGYISENMTSMEGQWIPVRKDKSFSFKLNQVIGKSYWDFIRKNRSLYEYKDINLAIKEGNSVLSIDVASKKLNMLPDSLSILPRIVSINLLGNDFIEFPIVISKLTTLDEISLSSNKLTHIGSEIGKLINLRILIINNNKLESLPKEIGKLTNLLYLEVGNNLLTMLPSEIKRLKNLQELHIERNRLSDKEKQKIKKLLPNCVIYF